MEHSLHVVGTAGHVDHGKSTLVHALTGMDPDRLAEEKARAMTIDLGFAWLTIGDEEIGIVDVPGHRDFIENMLAGVGGIDLALFVIAADEGVMPQTREHLAILDLLEIQDGVVAITKVDLVDDADWLELVMLDAQEIMAGTVLQDAPLIPVSAHTGQGLDRLKRVLVEQLARRSPRPDLQRPRLPVDRVFSLAGFGTVVTGTLSDGKLAIGDQVEIVPGKLKGRVRGLQTHKRKLQEARPGSRVAINLSGVDRDQLSRGQVVCAPGTLEDTVLIDVRYRHLLDAGEPLRHNRKVKLFVGAAEVLARTRVIGREVIEAGEEGWLQLALDEPIAVARDDRFILRRPSPPQTIGGGVILDPYPGRRHRRFRAESTQRLQTLAEGDPKRIILLTLDRRQPLSRAALIEQSGVEPRLAAAAVDEMLAAGSIREVGGQILSSEGWRQLHATAVQHVAEFHERHSLRLGMPREALRSRLRIAPAVFNTLVGELVEQGVLVEEGTMLRLAEHAIRYAPDQETRIAATLRNMERAGANTPSVKEVQRALSEEIYWSLVDSGRLVPLNADVLYGEEQLQTLKRQIVDYLRREGEIDAAKTRDLLNTSRKYAIAILEYLDDTKVTRRVGDVRVLR